MASKWLAGVLALALLWLIWHRSKGLLMGLVVLWLSYEELQLAIGGVWYALDPWYVPPGVEILSAKVGADIGSISIVVVAALAGYIAYPLEGK